MSDEAKQASVVPSTEAGTTVYEGSHGGYEIHSTPGLKTVTPGAKVTYYCNEKTSKIFAEGAKRDTMRWYCIMDQASMKWYSMGPVILGPFGWRWENYEWHKLGRHTIQCSIRRPDGSKFILEYPQWVDTVESVLGEFAKEQKVSEMPSPESELSVVTRKIPALQSARNKVPIKDPNAGIPYDILKYMDKTGSRPTGAPPKTKQELHDARIKELEKYRDKLGEQMASTEGHARIPFKASHLAIETQRKTHLRVFLSEVKARRSHAEGVADEYVWHLVDWTNPVDRRCTGVYEGTGETPEAAIRDAVEVWNAKNRYYDGRIQFEIPASVCGKAIEGSFETDGKSSWDSIATFFEVVATGAAILAGVITMIAPVPGSQVVSGLIWTSIFAGMASATINIGQRYQEGFSNWNEDALDTLSIVANVFGAAWFRCASVTGKAISASTKQFVLYGQVATDGVEGVLIAAQSFGEFEAMMEDDSLMPEQRFDKMLGFFRQLALQGLMKYVNMKGTAEDLANIKPDVLARFKNPKETIDLDQTPKSEVHVTKEKDTGVVRVQSEHPRVHAGSELPKSHFPEAKPPHKRGMRERDDIVLSEMAKDSGNIVIVRDSNQAALKHVGQKNRLPKPEDVKAKTLKSGKNEGLAAYSPETHAAEMAKLPESERVSFEKYQEQLKAKGYTIAGPEDDYIIKDLGGNAFYSDYDLHGVYDGKTGKNAYTDGFKDELNDGFGVKLVQHGPHDNWNLKTDPVKAKVNYGPQPPCTAYLPDGTSVRLDSVADMHKFYKDHNLDWNGLYGQIDWKIYKKNNPTAVLGELEPK